MPGFFMDCVSTFEQSTAPIHFSPTLKKCSILQLQARCQMLWFWGCKCLLCSELKMRTSPLQLQSLVQSLFSGLRRIPSDREKPHPVLDCGLLLLTRFLSVP